MRASTRPTPRIGPQAPVISVGNLAMGGRGKTPVVALVARLLASAGERPAILSRGYKRRQPDDGVVIVSDGVRMRADLDRAGDEPLMLARLVPGAAVLVCDVRATAATLAERILAVTVHVLDDGFQHRTLGRDIDLVLVTPEDLDDRRLPFGRLRSPVTDLARADAVILDAPDAAPVSEAIRRYARDPAVPIFRLARSLGGPEWIDGDGLQIGPQTPVFAVAGIAAPHRFAAALVHRGYRVVGGQTFRDHHHYDRRDVKTIHDGMRASQASVVFTTQKDAVRLLPLRPLPFVVAAVPLEVTVEPAEVFRDWLLARLDEARG
jgi:tetraacyldisaccharide 4'-kinase